MRSSSAERPTTVLVVDDEEPVRRFVSTVLRGAGYQVEIGTDGPDALRIAEASQPFDMLVTDLLMPGMTGDEVSRNLRQRWPALKVLYLSGHADQLFAEKMTLWEGEAFLDKPCEVAALLEAASLLVHDRVPTPAAAPSAAEGEPASPEPWRSMTRRDEWSS